MLPWLLALALAGTLAWAFWEVLRPRDSARAHEWRVRRSAYVSLPVIQRPDEVVRLVDLRGKGVLLLFLGRGCRHCPPAVHTLQRVADRYAGKFLAVVGVVAGDPERAAAWVNELGIRFPVLHDRRGVLAERFRVRGVPHLVFIGPDGRPGGIRVGVPDPVEVMEGAAGLIRLARGDPAASPPSGGDATGPAPR